MTTPGGGAYSAGTIYLQVVPSFRNFQRTVRQAAKDAEKAFAESMENGEIDKAVDKALGKSVEKSAKARGQEMGSILARETGKKVDSLLKNLSPILRIEADTGVAKREIDLLLRRALKLRDALELEVDVDGAKEAEKEFRQLFAMAQALDGHAVDIDANAHVAKAVAEIRKLEGAVRDVNGEKIRIDAEGVDNFIHKTQGASQALRGFNGWVLAGAALGPILVPVLGALAVGMAALGSAAIGAAAGVGVLMLAFSGVGDAVKALGKEQEDGAEQARALAKTQRAAAQAVGDAQRSVADAQRNAGESARDAAERVSDAQRNIVRAHRDAERSIRRALDGVERAERDLARAQRESTEAQQELREVRQAAKDDLLDLESKVKKGALDERQMLIDLFEAQVEYNAAMADGAATNLEREQAAIALERARLAISDQRRENKALREEQKKTNDAGVEGSERVVRANEQAQRQAERVADAQQNLADAQQRVSDAREDAAERIADAERNLADARADQARAHADSQRAIADAQRNLTEAQLNYADAMAQTTSSADAVADAMGKLSPAGQRFALFLHSLRDEFGKLRAAAQEGMLPGVETAMKNLLPYMPQITAFVGSMARVLGDLFVAASEALTSPIWRDFFGMINELAPVFTTQFAQVMGNIMTIFAQLATAFAPMAVKFGDALVSLTKGWSDFLASERGQKMLQDFMGYAERVGPKVMKFLDSFIDALANLVVGIAPYGEMFLGVLTGILDLISMIPPDVLGALVFAIVSMVFAFQALSGLLGVLGAISGVMATLGVIFGITAAAALGWVLAIAAVVIGIGILYAKSETFRDIVNGAFKAVGAVIMWFWNRVVKPAVNLIVGYWRFMWSIWSAIFDLVIKAVQKLGGVIADLYRKYLKPYVDAIVSYLKVVLAPVFDLIVDAATKAFDGLKNVFKGVVKFVVDVVINDGLIGNFNKLADFFGSKKISRIQLPGSWYDTTNTGRKSGKHGGGGYAAGGMVGGFSPTPTADNIPAWLTAGEFVLPVHAVKKLRGAYGDQFLDWLRGGGGYAKGGLVEFGRLLQSRNFRVNEHPAFGGVRGKHAPNSFHYKGQAIDVNYGPGGTNAIEQRAIDGIIGMAKDYGLRTIWRTAGHFNHAHFDTGGSGGSMLGKLGDMVGDAFSGAVDWVKDGPLSWFKSKALGFMDRIGDNPMGKVIIGFGKKLVDNALGGVAKIAGIAGDFADDDPEAKPKLYDQGGWLPPGLSSVANLTGKPELILTPEQAEQVLRGGGQYSITVPMMPTNSTPADVADAVLFAARRIQRGGVYAGRSN